MSPEGLVPSLLVFGFIPTFPAFQTDLPSQKDRTEATASTRSEMTTITAKLRIQQALSISACHKILSDRSEHHDEELQRLLTSIKQFNTDLPPAIFLTEVLDPSDYRKNLPQCDLAKVNKLEGLARQRVFEIVAKDEVPTDANILGG